MIRPVHTNRLFALALLARAIAAAPAPQAPSARASFNGEIRPLLNHYCLVCHSAARHTGDIDLERFTSVESVLQDPRVWQKVAEQLTAGEMPPKGMPQPSPDERARFLAWANDALSTAAKARAGDPGPVVLRRLNNAEYTFTIRDLTGVASLDPAREFPVDGAAGEGFTNTGNALVMSPSLITKYLDAGKAIANHAVLLSDGIRFSQGSSRRDWTDEILAEIRAFYRTFTEDGGGEQVMQQGIALDKNRGGSLPLRKYLAASLALRAASPPSVEAVAQQNGLSPKYLGTLVKLLKDTRTSPLLDGLRARWRTANSSDIDTLVTEIARWQSALWKFSSVGHIGKEGGPKAWMEPVDPVVDHQEFRVKLNASRNVGHVSVYLAVHDAGGGQTRNFVVWRQPKLVIPGRPPVLLRDLRPFVDELTARRARILGLTAKVLMAAAEGDTDRSALARRFRVDPEALDAWFDFLGVNTSTRFKLDLLTKKIEKTGAYDFLQGWGSSQTPMLLANSSNQHVRVPGNMKPHSVAVHPSQTLNAAVGWRSPLTGILRVEGTITRAHAECGTGITWSLELRRGRTRQQLASGEARGAAAVPVGPFENVRVQRGDLLSVIIGPREGNHACDLTDLDLRLTSQGPAPLQWSLVEDVAGGVLASNPHADRVGHEQIWHFYTEPVTAPDREILLPAGSLLARWQAAEQPEERRQLAEALQKLLTSPSLPPTDTSPDAALYRQLTSLAGPLFAGPADRASTTPKSSPQMEWGLDPSQFGKHPNGTPIEAASLCVRVPSVLSVRLPADLVANSEFVTTGTLDQTSSLEGSVQLEVLTSKPEARSGLLPMGTTVGDAKGKWSSNNQTVSYVMPVVVNEHSMARKRILAAFDEFRQAFPAALCYTKIVPVDEVVTLTLFHREDDHLSRLILNTRQKAQLDRLWDELHYVSRDALTLVDAFEQLWQFATQDADPSKFEPLRQPIQARAAAFRQRLIDTEPRHVDAVVEFAGRAYRRPLTEGEKSQLRNLYHMLRQQGVAHEESIRLMLARVLVAPAFLYRAENAPPGRQAVPVDDYELANRLSYFLWSSMPDVELRDAAASGKLRSPAGLQAQIRRMLRDERVRRMGTEFGAAWMHLYGFDTLDEKSERQFPSFRDLRGAMYEETIRFFTDLFMNNGSVLTLLDSDYTFLNEALAKHYGIPGVTGPEWRRVDGIRQYSRGGILGQAAILAKQAGASRTSPILRGNWIMEVLLGEKLPRPPKDVPQLPADEAAQTLSVRELTEKHTADRRCSGCHARIDPYGYTLERFDAIGRYRDKDLGNRPINDRATAKDGSDLQGVEGLRSYLLTKGRDAFVRQFCRKLLGYALGRAVVLSDEPLLNDLQTRLGGNGYHVRTAIEMIATSPQFQKIRGRDHEQEHE